MLKLNRFSCYFAECSKIPCISCKCSNPYVNSCSDHIEQHSRLSQRDHAIMFIASNVLEGLKKEKAIKKIKKRILELKEIANQAVNACTEVMNKVTESLKAIISQVNEIKITLLEAKGIILSNRPIDNEFLNELMGTGKFNLHTNHNQIIKLVSENFSFKLLTNVDFQEEYALFNRPSEKILRTVNLDTFKASTFSNSGKCWYWAGACRISHNKYFLTSGIEGSTYLSHASIIDLNRNAEEEALPESSTKKNVPGCICKDNKVYVFGGYNGSLLVSSEKFDLSTKKWNPIPNLPAGSCPTSSIINDKIIVTGYGLNYVYIFDNDRYIQNLSIPSGYNIACDKWIFTLNSLFECLNLEANQWGKYTISSGNSPSIWIAHKKDKYIYFITHNDFSLWRINTKSKSAEKCSYA